MVEPLRTVAGMLGTADMVTIVGVSTTVAVAVLTSIEVEADVVAPFRVVVSALDSMEIVTEVKPAPVVEEVTAVIGLDTVVVVSARVVGEELVSAEVIKDVLVEDVLASVDTVLGVPLSAGDVEYIAVSAEVVRDVVPPEVSPDDAVVPVMNVTVVEDTLPSDEVVSELVRSVGVVEDVLGPEEVVTGLILPTGGIEDVLAAAGVVTGVVLS